MHAPLTFLLLAAACAPSPNTPENVAVTPPRTPDALELRRRAMSEELRSLVSELEAAGRYDCCIGHPCKWCAVRSGGCRCGAGARAGEPVCEECAMMWMKGHGAEPVDKSTIRSFLEAEREANGEYGAICGQRPAPTP